MPRMADLPHRWPICVLAGDRFIDHEGIHAPKSYGEWEVVLIFQLWLEQILKHRLERLRVIPREKRYPAQQSSPASLSMVCFRPGRSPQNLRNLPAWRTIRMLNFMLRPVRTRFRGLEHKFECINISPTRICLFICREIAGSIQLLGLYNA